MLNQTFFMKCEKCTYKLVGVCVVKEFICFFDFITLFLIKNNIFLKNFVKKSHYDGIIVSKFTENESEKS